MKKFDFQKSVQMIIFILITVACALIIFFNKGLFHTIGTDSGVKLMCGMLWLTLGLSFLFIYMDFSFFSKFNQNYRELDYVAQTDRVAGIANRFSSDALIDKYLDKELPSDIGCIMLAITNLGETNELYGHVAGNQMIKDFSTILKLTSVGLCFVARNGGNRFLAVFENTDTEKMQLFIDRINQKIAASNSEPGTHPIKYDYGAAFSGADSVPGITELIALSDKRIGQ